VVPPAAPTRALGPGVVQRSKLFGSFLQPEQKTRRVADDQGTQKGFSTGPGASPALPPPREGGGPAAVPSAAAEALPAARTAHSRFAAFGVGAPSPSSLLPCLLPRRRSSPCLSLCSSLAAPREPRTRASRPALTPPRAPISLQPALP